MDALYQLSYHGILPSEILLLTLPFLYTAHALYEYLRFTQELSRHIATGSLIVNYDIPAYTAHALYEYLRFTRGADTIWLNLVYYNTTKGLFLCLGFLG